MKSVDYTKLLAKLDRPPSGHNWVRLVHSDVPKTTKSILSFVKGKFPFTYRPGYAAIQDRIQMGIAEETALKIACNSGSAAGYTSNSELVAAFFEYDKERRYTPHTSIGVEKERFAVSRDVEVPIVPLSVIREGGKFVPIFVCGWSKLDLTVFQRRLLVSIYEDAFLSLTDFLDSPAEFLFFPKTEQDGERERAAEVWERGDYSLLSDRDLNEAVDIFLQAREEARRILIAELAESAAKQETSSETPFYEASGDLFDGE
ncbi:hypothetical protein BR141012304_20396 [Brucella inopinata]|nr:hypothetical protein BR141012304_20396 [Brucella inopinata]